MILCGLLYLLIDSIMKNSWAFIPGISVIIAFGLWGWFFQQSRQVQQTVRVLGYGTEEFDSDIVKWSVSFLKGHTPNSIPACFPLPV